MITPRIAIVVVTYNSRTLVPDLLASLPAGADGLDWHLIVADNGSSDETVATVRELAPRATVVEMGRNAGYAAGINAAVAAALPHDAILVLNPDVRLGLGCLPALWRALDHPGVGIAVPRLVDANGQLILSMRREPTVLRALGDALIGAERAGRFSALGEVISNPDLYSVETLTDWAEGSTQLISESCWRACKGWDERFFLYSEETEFNLRARDGGYGTAFVPGAQAVHLEGDSARSPKLWALLATNRVRLFRLRHGLIRTILFWATTILREASRAAIGKRTSRAAVRALMDRRLLDRRPRAETIG
jgi:N-acetylglucosaminyl-diphospho-decaprenol L-rhamnosyltransferase